MNSKNTEQVFFDVDWQPPPTIYGENIVLDIIGSIKDCESWVITMEIPWKLTKNYFKSVAQKVAFVTDTTEETLKDLLEKIHSADLIIGIGAGTVMDAAKYIALKKQASLFQIPTIISNDAWLSDVIALRKNGKIHYVAHVIPDKVIVDFSLIRKSPKRLNRYGTCDILSIHTALYDWKLATDRAKKTKNPLLSGEYNNEVAKQAKSLLGRLCNYKKEIYNVTEEGIKMLMKFHIDSVKLAQTSGTYRTAEGSEHLFAYNAEYVTKRSYMHGALVGMGIFVMSYLQKNNFQEIVNIMEDIGLEYKPVSFGFKKSDFIKTLLTIKKFSEELEFPYTVINEIEMDRAVVGKIVDLLYS